jgi:methionine-rich copper-binding protein CopC
VRAVPAVVRAWYNDELDPKHSALGVWDARGKRVDDGKGGVDLNDLDRKSMLARLRPLPPGVYTVRWTAVSLDDQNVAKGSFRFTLAATR